MSQSLRAGADVDTYCSRCKMELAHVIIAMSGSTPAQVECKTCRGVHKFKSPSQSRPRMGSITRKAKAGARITTFDAAMAGKDISQAKRYRTTEPFTQDDVINHPKFGLGIVTKSHDGKIDVVFRDGVKVLACASG